METQMFFTYLSHFIIWGELGKRRAFLDGVDAAAEVAVVRRLGFRRRVGEFVGVCGRLRMFGRWRRRPGGGFGARHVYVRDATGN